MTKYIIVLDSRMRLALIWFLRYGRPLADGDLQAAIDALESAELKEEK